MTTDTKLLDKSLNLLYQSVSQFIHSSLDWSREEYMDVRGSRQGPQLRRVVGDVEQVLKGMTSLHICKPVFHRHLSKELLKNSRRKGMELGDIASAWL